MNYFVFLALLPCIFAAEIQNESKDEIITCNDGTQCSEGKYCCELPSGKSGCCEISKELKDKGYVPALPSSSSPNETIAMAQPDTMNAYCPGTQCGDYCIPSIRATCCPKPNTACPYTTKCCSNTYYGTPWCCKSYQSCSSYEGMCRNGAVTTSIAMMWVLLALMFGAVSKYFL